MNERTIIKLVEVEGKRFFAVSLGQLAMIPLDDLTKFEFKEHSAGYHTCEWGQRAKAEGN